MARFALAAMAAALSFAAAPPAGAQAPTGATPLKLGMILDMSGVYTDVTGRGSVAAARMAVADFGGSVLGRPIEVLVADHTNKPDVAEAKAREWFANGDVTAILDVTASSPALAVMSVANQYKRIVMLDGPGAESIVGANCNPYTVLYTYDTYALAHVAAAAEVARGGKNWFFMAADYTFGTQLEHTAEEVVRAKGGTVLGAVRVPLGIADFSSYLLQAQASHAQVVGLATAGADLDNTIKQASEFGLTQSGARLAGLLTYITDVHAVGLKAAQGMVLASAFYWNTNDATRAFARRYYAEIGRMPNMSQAGVYSSTMHYLQAVKSADTTESGAVMKAMKAAPINDFFAHDGHIRADGLMVHDMYLFEVKSPAESKEPWDYYRQVATIPGEEAFGPISESKCPLVGK